MRATASIIEYITILETHDHVPFTYISHRINLSYIPDSQRARPQPLPQGVYHLPYPATLPHSISFTVSKPQSEQGERCWANEGLS